MLPITAPIRASDISARVELTSPAFSVVEVQENVTQATVVDIQRYLRWAEKAIKSPDVNKQSRKSEAPPKAA